MRTKKRWKGDGPLKDQMIASETTMSMSGPSRKKTSHTRSCVWNGSVVENSVMYHFVANEEVEIISFF